MSSAEESFKAEMRRLVDERARALYADWASHSNPARSNDIGLILHAHLFVELRLRRHLQILNPNLGSIESARLRFPQLLSLVDSPRLRFIPHLLEGFRALNAVRNGLAHSLTDPIPPSRLEPMISVLLTTMDGVELSREFCGQHPAATCKIFARWACFLLVVDEAIFAFEEDQKARLAAIHEEMARLQNEFLAGSAAIEPG